MLFCQSFVLLVLLPFGLELLNPGKVRLVHLLRTPFQSGLDRRRVTDLSLLVRWVRQRTNVHLLSDQEAVIFHALGSFFGRELDLLTTRATGCLFRGGRTLSGIACATYLSHDLSIDPLGRTSDVFVEEHALTGPTCNRACPSFVHLLSHVLLPLLLVQEVTQVSEVLLVQVI